MNDLKMDAQTTWGMVSEMVARLAANGSPPKYLYCHPSIIAQMPTFGEDGPQIIAEARLRVYIVVATVEPMADSDWDSYLGMSFTQGDMV